MSAKKIPITFVYPALALTKAQAAAAMGVSLRTFYRLRQEGKIRATSYGVTPVFEIERHLREEVAA